MPKPMTALPEPRFRVRKHKWAGGWFIQHYDVSLPEPGWRVYEDISSTRVPIAKVHSDREKAVAEADRLNRRYPWKDFDRQLFERRAAGDKHWPSSPGETAAVIQIIKDRRGQPTP